MKMKDDDEDVVFNVLLNMNKTKLNASTHLVSVLTHHWFQDRVHSQTRTSLVFRGNPDQTERGPVWTSCVLLVLLVIVLLNDVIIVHTD